MVAALSIVDTIVKGISVLSSLGNENQRLQGQIKGRLDQLSLEVRVAQWDMVKYEGAEGLTLQMQELLYDIEDFICDLSIPEKSDALIRHAAGMDSRPEDIARIDSFLASIDSIRKRQEDYSKRGNATVLPESVLPESSTTYAPEKDLEGFPKTKNEFLELLSISPVCGEQPRVISIVGCSGLGKTALARAVYESAVVQLPPLPTTKIHEPSAANTFQCKAWVVASSCNNAGDLITKVLNQVHQPAARGSNTSLEVFLHDKRYLVVVDDLRSDGVQWKDIQHAFRKNDKDSRIIVTTSVHSIAMDCSSGSYYVYPMQCLGEANSKGLFWKNFFGSPCHRSPSAPEDNRSENMLAKCDGLPLALISAGNYFCWKDRQPFLSENRYRGVCEELDNLVASDEIAFCEMKRKFLQCYNSLTEYDEKNCLLYLSTYPQGHQINSKSVVRRLKAEELVAGDVIRCLEKLIDKSIIKPAEPIRNSYNVAKRCQVQGMMLEFIIHKSMCRNFVTLVDEGIVRHKKEQRRQTAGSSTVRRLTVRSSSGSDNLIPDEIRLSSVRSLTIFKSKLLPKARVYFKSCKMTRVLDLEGCEGLNNSSCILDDICELPFLKYLSLRNTDVVELRPTKVKKLMHLETLDLRGTCVVILPVEVIMLPELAHLFGEFELPLLAQSEKRALTRFLKEKSKLQTLAGIVINNNQTLQGFSFKDKTQGFKIVILHARNLKKVKICSKQDIVSVTASSPRSAFAFLGRRKQKQNSYSYAKVVHQPPTDAKLVGVLVSSLQERFMRLESISIESSVISKAFLGSDLKQKSCIISSIKLQGALTSPLACKLKDIRNLRKVHLFSTGLNSQQLVEALEKLDNLEYLKLSEEDLPDSWDGDFSVESGGFPALRELCFQGPSKYPRLKIAQEAMCILASLQLLCRQPPTCVMGVEGMKHLKYLQEVILHHSADNATVQAWKEAAKLHSNMPCVKKHPA